MRCEHTALILGNQQPRDEMKPTEEHGRMAVVAWLYFEFVRVVGPGDFLTEGIFCTLDSERPKRKKIGHSRRLWP
jgi:hypothetical protein